MYHVTFEHNPKAFLEKHGDYLKRNEAEHNLILSLCQTAEERRARGEAFDIRFATLSNDDGVVLASVQTPPQNIVLSRAAQPDFEALAETLAAHAHAFPGIVGPSDIAAAFAEKWHEKTGQEAVEIMDQIIYSLKQVTFPAETPAGSLRPAKPGEEQIIAAWMMDFAREALPKTEQVTQDAALQRAGNFIKSRRVFVWDVDGQPRAQAAFSGTQDVARINMVYTPQEERGKGYASAVVSRLSQQQLDAGKKMCCLYADARNSVSNSIYRKIGYEFVGRSSLHVLGAKSG